MSLTSDRRVVKVTPEESSTALNDVIGLKNLSPFRNYLVVASNKSCPEGKSSSAVSNDIATTSPLL